MELPLEAGATSEPTVPALSQPCPSLVGGTGQVQVLQDGRSREDLAQDLLAHVLRRSEKAPLLLVKAVEVQSKTQRSAIRIRSKQLPPVSWRAPLAAAFPAGPLPKNVVLRTNTDAINRHQLFGTPAETQVWVDIMVPSWQHGSYMKVGQV